MNILSYLHNIYLPYILCKPKWGHNNFITLIRIISYNKISKERLSQCSILHIIYAHILCESKRYNNLMTLHKR